MMASQQSSQRTKTQVVSSREEENLGIVKRALWHRRDSIQGADIANYFFLNLRVSRTKIENLK